MKKIVSALIAVFIFSITAFSQLPCNPSIAIQGPQTVCLGSTFTYYSNTGVPDPVWTVTGGTIIVNMGESKTIQWNASGVQTITATCGSYSGTLQVTVGPSIPPAPSAITSGSSDGANYDFICPNTTATYSITLEPS